MSNQQLMKCSYCGQEIESEHVNAKVYHLECAMKNNQEAREKQHKKPRRELPKQHRLIEFQK